MMLILVRHGETEVNRLGRIQGAGHAPLNASGRRQAMAVARGLAPDAPFALYSSPLRRAVQTAQAISDRTGIHVVREEDLSEMDVGDFDGLSGPQLRKLFPGVMRMWDHNPAEAVMPGGESLSVVRDRAWRAVLELARCHAAETVVAVTHNFTIQTILCTALDMPLNSSRKLRVDLGSITRLHISGSRVTQHSVNETWHLK